MAICEHGRRVRKAFDRRGRRPRDRRRDHALPALRSRLRHSASALTDALRQSGPRSRGRLLVARAAAFRPRQGVRTAPARRTLRRAEGAQAWPRQRRPASERAFGPCDGKSGRAGRQATRRHACDAPPHAGRPRGLESADGGGNARLLGRAQVARGARGVPGLPVAEGEAAIGSASRSDAAEASPFLREIQPYWGLSRTWTRHKAALSLRVARHKSRDGSYIANFWISTGSPSHQSLAVLAVPGA